MPSTMLATRETHGKAWPRAGAPPAGGVGLDEGTTASVWHAGHGQRAQATQVFSAVF